MNTLARRFPGEARVLALAIPVVLSLVSDGVLTGVDSALVRGFGNDALAAIGTTAVLTLLASAIMSGLATGVQALIGRERGAGRPWHAATGAGLVVVVAAGALLTLLVEACGPAAIDAVTDAPSVRTLAHGYLGMRALGFAGVAVRMVSRAFWIPTGRPWRYLSILLVEQLVNVGLAVTLIFGHLGLPALGVKGAGLATALAAWTGAAIHLAALASRLPRGRRMQIDRAAIVDVLRLGAPAALQQLLYAGYATALFAVMLTLGTTQGAASKVAFDLLMPAWAACAGVGMTVTSLVSGALGAGRPDEAKRWPLRAVPVALLLIAPLFAAGTLFPGVALGVFLRDPAALALARWPLRVMALVLPLEALGQSLTFAMLGAARVRTVVVVSILPQWLLALPIAYVLSHLTGAGLVGAWGAHAAYRGITAIVLLVAWGRTARKTEVPAHGDCDREKPPIAALRIR